LVDYFAVIGHAVHVVLVHGQPGCQTQNSQGAPSRSRSQFCMQLLKDHHARELLLLYDAAHMVCEGLDALRCVMVYVRRPDLSFVPQTLSIR
jgi:hypothetical protein